MNLDVCYEVRQPMPGFDGDYSELIAVVADIETAQNLTHAINESKEAQPVWGPKRWGKRAICLSRWTGDQVA